MNTASEKISNSIIEEDFKTIILGGKAYTIAPPTIKVICRTVKHFSKISLSEDLTNYSVIGEVNNNSKHIINGLSSIIIGNRRFWRIRSLILSKRLNPTPNELKTATETAVELMGGADFFGCATLAIEVAKIVANTKQ